jgi:hypothetical protein
LIPASGDQRVSKIAGPRSQVSSQGIEIIPQVDEEYGY